MRRLLRLTLILISVVGVGCVVSCGGTRVVMVHDGTPIQLAESVRAYVYITEDGERIKSGNRVELPEGWWLINDPTE